MRIILRTPLHYLTTALIEEQISSSHRREEIHEEYVVVSKINVDHKYFSMFVKRYSICKQEVGVLLNILTDNKYEMCCILASQFTSVFTMPKPTSVTFFLLNVTTLREDDLFRTDITLSNSIIIGAIEELSPYSAGGPDVILPLFWPNPYFF